MVRFTLELTVDTERFAEFEIIAKAMTANSRTKPSTLGYEWWLSKDRKH